MSTNDFSGFNSHSNRSPIRTKIRNFPRYATQLSSLPIDENIRLAVVADFVADSYQPGSLPILQIDIIGHADKDAQRGSAFEKRISEERAQIVAKRLQTDVGIRTFSFNPVQTVPNPSVPRPTSIKWSTSGVGATEPDEENVKRGKNSSNMTDSDTKLNRRVEIILRPGTTPLPSGDADSILRDVLDRRWRPNIPPSPPIAPNPPLPNWFWKQVRPPTVDEWTQLKKEIKEALKNFDVETVIETIKDRVLPDAPSQGWHDDFLQLVDELDKARREGQKEWWKDDD